MSDWVRETGGSVWVPDDRTYIEEPTVWICPVGLYGARMTRHWVLH